MPNEPNRATAARLVSLADEEAVKDIWRQRCSTCGRSSTISRGSIIS